MRADQFVTGYVSQAVKVESKFTDYELAVMKGGLSLDKPKSALHRAVTEAFDQPYKILRWEKGDFGDVDAIARLDDGTFLSIMFNKGFSQGTKEEAWSVEFYRNNSQEVTGEGDAQRVFATVISAIQTFIEKYKPNKITFSASKEVETGQNTESRARLYDSLVQRYARSWGFRAFRADTGNKVIYELSRIKPVAEAREEFNQEIIQPGFEFSQKINGITYKVTGGSGSVLVEAWAPYGKRIGHAVFRYNRTHSGLESLSTSVKHEWEGKGIASTMYAVIRMLGANINPSIQQTTDGKNMWDRWHQHGDAEYIKKLNPKIKEQDVAENFADGKTKGKSRPGRVKRAGASCGSSVSDLRSKAKNASGERAKMYHWCANMKSGRAKNESEMLEDLNTIWKDVLEAGVYKGYHCTKDCSGHIAGYDWADAIGIDDANECPYSNNSFWEGCLAHTDEQE